jgi:short-subunit dehydrogenase
MAGQQKPTWNRALVTGASSGIGNAFARQLAAEGTSLVLVARDERRLDELASQLRQQHGVDVEVLAADLSDDEQVSHVEKRLSVSPPIDLLVNNAGLGTFGTFRQLPVGGELQQIDVNIRALVRLAHAALAFMSTQGGGTVVNMSSTLGLQPMPGSATYAATKAFVTSFSEALHEESRGTGVRVSALMPGTVRTEFMERAGKEEALTSLPSFMVLSPDKVAHAGLRGARRGRALIVPGASYKMMATFMTLSPRWLVRRFSGVMGKNFM